MVYILLRVYDENLMKRISLAMILLLGIFLPVCTSMRFHPNIGLGYDGDEGFIS